MRRSQRRAKHFHLVPPNSEAISADIAAFRKCWNEGLFFEAHETLEPRWIQERDPGMQGLIQLAAAFHHLQKGNTRGARTMLQRAIPRLRNPRNAPCVIDQKQLANCAESTTGLLDTKSASDLIDARPRL
jgi:predicted metal-dependent hydrolase